MDEVVRVLALVGSRVEVSLRFVSLGWSSPALLGVAVAEVGELRVGHHLRAMPRGDGGGREGDVPGGFVGFL